ncbi:MAG: hypothetical protein ACK5IC_04495 [Moheibacter sp.]
MEYKIHKVEAEEKLADISEKYNISVEEIKRENPDGRFIKVFLGPEYAGHMQDLKIPIKHSPFEDEKKPSKIIEKNFLVDENENIDYDFTKPKSFIQIPLILKNSDNEYQYEINQKQYLSLNKKHLYDTETKMVWMISDIVVSDEFFTLKVRQKEHKLERTHSVLKDLAKFAQIFNIPLANLHLKFSLDGKFLSILNQEEIKANWEKLKSNQLNELLENKETKSIIDEGDKDFSDSKHLIKNSFLYHLVFPLVYGNILISEYSMPSEPILCKSNVFQNQVIKLNIQRKNTNIEDEFIRTILVGKNPTEKEKIDKLEKIFEAQFGEMVKEKFNYEYSFTSKYNIDKQTGLIQNIICHAKEKLSNNFFHQSEYTINLIPKGENE